MTDRYLESEEAFHTQDRKSGKKERRRLQVADRSKFKKTDQGKQVPPACADLPIGRVIAISAGGARVDVAGSKRLCSLRGLLKKEKTLSKNLIAVGDLVRFTPISETEGAIESVEPRYSFLVRQEIRGKHEQLIAVNVDIAVIVVSIATPPLKPALIDRYLIAATRGGMHPLIAINKVDLLEKNSAEELMYHEALSAYKKLKIPLLSLSTHTHEGIEELKKAIAGKCAVFVGQSGVGKSSLLNSLFGLQLKIGILTEKTQKGSHTTTNAQLIPLAEGGYCVDTPGIRSFSLWNVPKGEIGAHFSEIARSAKRCKYPNCSHIDEPDCAVKKAVNAGRISPLRYESYLSLFTQEKERRR